MSLKRYSVSSEDSNWKIERTDKVGPGKYDLQKSWQSTQTLHVKGNHKTKSQRVVYFEAYAKMFAKIPAPNKYPNALAQLSMRSRKPRKFLTERIV